MDSRQDDHAPATGHASTQDDDVPCWKELLDNAFAGWEPADQTIERIIDRMERTS